MPLGAAMSLPAWEWPERASPYTPVVVPATGALRRPAPQPPAAAGAGAVDIGFTGAGADAGCVVFDDTRRVVPVCLAVVGTEAAGAVPSGVAFVRFDVERSGL